MILKKICLFSQSGEGISIPMVLLRWNLMFVSINYLWLHLYLLEKFLAYVGHLEPSSGWSLLSLHRKRARECFPRKRKSIRWKQIPEPWWTGYKRTEEHGSYLLINTHNGTAVKIQVFRSLYVRNTSKNHVCNLNQL